MKYRFLGKSGLKVSAFSFGSWVTFGDQVDEARAKDCMIEAYKGGVNFFDNAEAYAEGKSEIMMGNIIKKEGWKRSDLVLSTKIFWGGDGPNNAGLSYKHIVEGTDAALERMQTDYVDLIFCHRPDKDTPIEETVWAMNQLIKQGKAFYWGTSEWPAEKIREAYRIARREHLRPPLMEQPQYNMFHRERVEKEYNRLYDELGLGTTIWSPLASGLLTGKYNDGIPDDSRLSLDKYDWLRENLLESEEGKQNLGKVRQLAELIEDIDLEMAELALLWCLKNPNVSTVITGASKPEQVRKNIQAIEKIDLLTNNLMKQIEDVLDNKPTPETDFKP